MGFRVTMTPELTSRWVCCGPFSAASENQFWMRVLVLTSQLAVHREANLLLDGL